MIDRMLPPISLLESLYRANQALWHIWPQKYMLELDMDLEQIGGH